MPFMKMASGEKKYDGKYGYEILTENTVEQLKYVHAVYDLAEECGDVSDSSYERLWPITPDFTVAVT